MDDLNSRCLRRRWGAALVARRGPPPQAAPQIPARPSRSRTRATSAATCHGSLMGAADLGDRAARGDVRAAGG